MSKVDLGSEEARIWERLEDEYHLAIESLTVEWPDLSALPACAQDALAILRGNQLRILKALKAIHQSEWQGQ